MDIQIRMRIANAIQIHIRTDMRMSNAIQIRKFADLDMYNLDILRIVSQSRPLSLRYAAPANNQPQGRRRADEKVTRYCSQWKVSEDQIHEKLVEMINTSSRSSHRSTRSLSCRHTFLQTHSLLGRNHPGPEGVET